MPAILKIRHTPDPSREIPRKSGGKSTQLGVCEYWCFLFELNEGLRNDGNGKPIKMTDEELLRQIMIEFPERPQAWTAIKEGRRRVGHYRSRYNGGTLGGKKGKPRIKSYRYADFDGRYLRINGTTGKPLPDAQQQKTPGPKRRKKKQ